MKFDAVIAERPNKTVYRLGDRCYKVFDESYSKAGILNEALNTARVEDTGLNIPRILEVTNVDGKWAIVTDYIPGKTLYQLMQENPDKFDEYLEQFVDLQLDVLSHKCPLLGRLKDKMHGKISASSFPATVRYDLHTTLESMPKHLKLCHGDFNPANIIIGDDGKTYIIDWAHATQGNASADAARTYLLFSLNEHEDVAKKYLKLFCEKSDTAIQYVQKWMPIVAASQSVKGNAHEREFLERWVNVVDYV
ncbi:MAG: phosphotransferase [Oscillospiraceae bacterium]|nr:phosphotransferase [Oscillospiraceae bacterium]